MAPLIQPVVTLIGILAAVAAIPVTAISVAALLMRQLRWMGLDALDRTTFGPQDGDFLP